MPGSIPKMILSLDNLLPLGQMYKTGVTHKSGKKLKLFFSAIILALLGVYIADNIYPIIREFAFAMEMGSGLFLLIYLLVIPNLYCESRKWLSLLNDDSIRLSKTLRAILLGMAAGFITPNRIGEFAGRVSAFEKVDHPKVIAMTWIGSTLQGSITVVFGLTALFIFPFWSQIKDFIQVDISLHILLLVAVSAILYFSFRSKVAPYLRSIVQSVKSLKTRNVLYAMPWAVLRYITFTTQIALALHLFGYNGPLGYCFAGIAVMFLVQSYLPLTSFAELGIREFLAVLIFGGMMSQPALAAVATLVVWLANIGIPVAVGSFLLQKSKHKPVGIT